MVLVLPLLAPSYSSCSCSQFARQGSAINGFGLRSSSSISFPKPHVKSPVSQSRRSSKIVAYFGLTTPPYKLIIQRDTNEIKGFSKYAKANFIFDALEPYMSKRTVELHWGKLHQEQVNILNKKLAISPFYGYTMDEMVRITYNRGNPSIEFDNVAEVWSHDFFWESMQPNGGDLPWGGVLELIEKDFGSFTNFKDQFVQSALSLFGSGWVWLYLKRNEKKLAVTNTQNAVNPLVWGDIPIICLDMWEHAYYLDYKDDRAKYVNNFLDHLVSWHSVMARMMRAEAFVNLGEPKIPEA